MGGLPDIKSFGSFTEKDVALKELIYLFQWNSHVCARTSPALQGPTRVYTSNLARVVKLGLCVLPAALPINEIRAQ